MATLERAIQIAHEAHKDELRRSGEPFVSHPMAVFEQARKLGYSVTRQIISVLHDVPENNPDWPIVRLREEGFEDDVLKPLRLLTKVKGADYDEYIEELEHDEDAAAVKELDIQHNLSDNPSEKQKERYARALSRLAARAAARAAA
jgi:(p)ppGpp synthase/HD superfamily hydrolase